MNRLLATLAVALAATGVRAEAAPVTLAPGLELHGSVDAYYAYNSHGGDNFLPGTGTTAHFGNAIDLNAATVELVMQPAPVGFHVTLAFGSGPDVVHAGEAAGGNHVFANVFQASASYTAPIGSGLLFEAGIYPSHIGFESFFSKDNWNYTRAWMGEFSPYYQTGVKVAYAFTPQWSAQIHFLNGWQNIRDNNRAKAVGTQVAYTGAALSVAFNTFAGPELPGDDSHWRVFGDLTAQWKASALLTLGVTADVGFQDLPAGSATWDAAALYARVAFLANAALTLRAEYYDDRDAIFSGASQLLREGTATLEVRPADHLILKAEARYDWSDVAVFASSTSQTLLVASAVATF